MKKIIIICILIVACFGINVSIAQNESPNFNALTNDQGISFGQETVEIITNNEVRNTNSIEVITMVNSFTFPYDISSDGTHVVIAAFGDSPGYYWNLETGLTSFEYGSGNGISDDGKIAGTYRMNVNDVEVAVAGYWESSVGDWTFLGENPGFPLLGGLSDYNSGWDITADGQTIVGLQFDNNYNAYAMQWHEEDGYFDLGGNTFPSNSSRASGISKDGSVIYGWVNTSGWMPAAWKNGELTIINEVLGGEAFGASENGTYVVGNFNDGFPPMNEPNTSFIWHSETGDVETVTNTLNGMSGLAIVGVLEDKTCFGWTVSGFPAFPDARRAFIRDPEGNMQTFNDYAESRGLEDAQDWLFYSVNAATPDGNIFIGTAQRPDGLDIGFYLSFNETSEQYALSLDVNPSEAGTTTGAGSYQEGEEVSITADVIGYYEFDNWTDAQGDVVSEDAITTIIMPGGDYELTANFHSTVGLEKIDDSFIQVYPNPADDFISIKGIKNVDIQIVDILGAVKMETAINDNSNIDISNLENGIYFIRILNNSEELVIKKITVH